MLAKLYIRNYALIDELEMELDHGLNILTGETGAGKSLLLGALGLILGRRVDYSYIFNPDHKCIVEAIFRNIPARTLRELQDREDFDVDGAEIIIRREARSNGKSRAFINDTPVALSVLKEVTGTLVDLHGQHENQLLLSQDQQLRLLDQFAGTTEEANNFGAGLHDIVQLQKAIAGMESKEKEARQQLDYFRFQFDELAAARLNADEESEIEEELGLLQNAEEIKESLQSASSSLFDDEASLYNQLSDIIEKLRNPASLNAGIKAQFEQLETVRFTLEDAARELESINGDVELDPERLQSMEERADELNRLKVKFSTRTIEELIAVRDDFDSKLGAFDSLGTEIEDKKAELTQAQNSLLKSGLKIEKKRQAVATTLKSSIDSLVEAVGLKDAEIMVEIARQEHAEGSLEIDGKRIRPNSSGLNQVDFKIRTNKGMPMGSLAQIASGGEVSRVMLAIKAALAARADLSVLIFDEIDTGISGETANMVGKVMKKLSEKYQLIAITHLPQIAGKGNRHFKIYKEVIDEKTVSRLQLLAEDARVLELARMISGENPSDSAIRSARELIG